MNIPKKKESNRESEVSKSHIVQLEDFNYDNPKLFHNISRMRSFQLKSI